MDLFDLVKSKPPPEKIRPSPVPASVSKLKVLSPVICDEADSPLPSPKISPLDTSSVKDVSILLSPDIDALFTKDELITTPSMGTPLGLETKGSATSTPTKEINKATAGTEVKGKSRPGRKKTPSKAEIAKASPSQTHCQRATPKSQRPTKAEKKQFDEQMEPGTDSGVSSVKQCRVRIKRMEDTQIDIFMTPKKPVELNVVTEHHESSNDTMPTEEVPLNQSTPIESMNRKRKANGGTDSPPALKKSNLHFKFGPKAAPKAKLGRGRKSPPPVGGSALLKRPKLTRAQLIKNFGFKTFRSYVRIQKCKHPVCVEFETKVRSSEMTRRSSKKSNLSVSFRDSVEIIGQSDTLNASSACSETLKSVPTRLTKIENGRVVQDVELDQSLFAVPSTSSTKGTRKRKRSLQSAESSGSGSSSSSSSSTSGSGRRSKSKRSNDYLPLSGLANLSINDDDNNEDEDQSEYIVPIEMPQCRTATTTTATENETDTTKVRRSSTASKSSTPSKEVEEVEKNRNKPPVALSDDASDIKQLDAELPDAKATDAKIISEDEAANKHTTSPTTKLRKLSSTSTVESAEAASATEDANEIAKETAAGAAKSKKPICISDSEEEDSFESAKTMDSTNGSAVDDADDNADADKSGEGKPKATADDAKFDKTTTTNAKTDIGSAKSMKKRDTTTTTSNNTTDSEDNDVMPPLEVDEDTIGSSTTVNATAATKAAANGGDIKKRGAAARISPDLIEIKETLDLLADDDDDICVTETDANNTQGIAVDDILNTLKIT